MLFNTDPLNLAALCSEPDGTKSLVAQQQILEKKQYSDTATFKCADVKDPLKLNDLIVNNEKDQQKINKKKRRRKRRYTETMKYFKQKKIKMIPQKIQHSVIW